MQAALDLSESGIKVYMVENKPSIGGVMSQLDKTFPTNDCSMCTMAPRLVAIGRHKDIEIISTADIQAVSGHPGNFKVTLNKRARYVDEEKCTGCGTCVSNCPTRNSVQPLEMTPVVLDPQFKDTVAEIIASNRKREGPLMPILQEINAAFNYLPEPVLRYVAQETGYSLTHILKIATFYSAFSITPRGKHIINVCMGTACYVRGSERLMERFSERLGIESGQTTQDMQFTLKAVRCIGCCGLAPAVMVGDDVHGKLSTSEAAKVIDKYWTA
jgi:NADH:ubiquinone oxidoreductase subunit E